MFLRARAAASVDWVACNMVAVRQGSLGHLRFVMKDGLQWLPLYGHYFYQHGCIYVRRGQFSQHKMVRGLEYLQQERIRVSASHGRSRPTSRRRCYWGAERWVHCITS